MCWAVRSVILAQLTLILAGAVMISALEKVGIGDALYFAFITGLTIGYGDIVAHTVGGRIVSVFLGVVGITFTGLIVAVAVRALQVADGRRENPKT